MARIPKSKPFATRLPMHLADFVTEYAEEKGMSASDVLAEAVGTLKRSVSRRRSTGKQQQRDTILEALRGSDA